MLPFLVGYRSVRVVSAPKGVHIYSVFFRTKFIKVSSLDFFLKWYICMFQISFLLFLEKKIYVWGTIML